MELRGDRPEAFRENGIGATMEEADRLSIAFHRHSSNHSIGRGFEDLDSHLGTEFTAPTFHEEVHVIGDRAIIGHVVMINESLAVAHSST